MGIDQYEGEEASFKTGGNNHDPSVVTGNHKHCDRLLTTTTTATTIVFSIHTSHTRLQGIGWRAIIHNLHLHWL